MADPESDGTLSPPSLVCAGCSFALHYQPEVCPGCGEKFRTRAAAPRRYYLALGLWLGGLIAIIAFVSLRDPSLGHAGRVVYLDEPTLEAANSDNSRLLGAGRAFRISRSDHVERMLDLPAKSPRNAWIRITSGPHRGRTGVVEW